MDKSRDVDEVDDLEALRARLCSVAATTACPRTSTAVHSLLEGMAGAAGDAVLAAP